MVTYTEYLKQIARLAQAVAVPGGNAEPYPATVRTAAQKALYNNLGKDATLGLAVDAAIQSSLQDEWRNNTGKTKRVRNSIRGVLEDAFKASQAAGFTGVQENGGLYSVEVETTRILELAKHQHEY